MLGWIARAAGLGRNWRDLARRRLITGAEARDLRSIERFLQHVRIRLHYLTGRSEDRLLFDYQERLASALGIEATAAKRASEVFMQRYYVNAKKVTQTNTILLQNYGVEIFPRRAGAAIVINDRFQAVRELLDMREDDTFARHPSALLECFLILQQRSELKGMTARTLRALWLNRKRINAAFRADPHNRELFLAILQQKRGIVHEFRRMNQYGILSGYLPSWRRIVGQMQHDLFHVYTVDQHILMVLRNVRRFFIAEHAHEYPFCSQLAAGWDKPYILYVAALFHDIAKGRGGDHSSKGARDVRAFCRDHAFTGEDARLIEFLVREHLTMSRVAQKEDLSDPAVITAFAKRVGNERALTALYLLTVADIRGTGPKVWNAWKGKLLEDLYRLTLRTLGGRAPDPHAEIEARKREALVQLGLYALPFQAHQKLWETLDVGYFMRHDASDIVWHTRHLSRYVGGHKPIVRARLSPVGEGLQVLVYTPDQPDLFARICGYFERAGFSILDAKIHTARNGFALDTFQVVSSMLPEHNRALLNRVEAELQHTIEQAGPLPAPSRGRVSRRVKSFPVPPRVTLAPDEKAQRWLLSVSASDRVGLLYSIARVLARHHLNLQLAKVSTLGERVEDTFLIDGPELQENRRQIEIETELLQALAA